MTVKDIDFRWATSPPGGRRHASSPAGADVLTVMSAVIEVGEFTVGMP